MKSVSNIGIVVWFYLVRKVLLCIALFCFILTALLKDVTTYCTSEEEEIKREFIILSKWQGYNLSHIYLKQWPLFK